MDRQKQLGEESVKKIIIKIFCTSHYGNDS